MKPITIVGGGLAGLTLGIALRKRGVRVKIIEAGRYPRHRVCGEFISGAGIQVLRDLQLDVHLKAVTKPVTRAAFFSVNQRVAEHRLPTPAVTISRFHLDSKLAEEFCRVGGDLETGTRASGTVFDEGFVCAMGRRAQPVENGWRWFGLKIHARGLKLESDLEMHVARNSYVGLCQLANGEVNVCGLFRRQTHQPAQGESIHWLRGERDSCLFQRLEHAEFDKESFCAVAGLSLRPQAIESSECRVGDALTMIPPITGNGMSMAFESAQLAVEPLMAYARGSVNWTSTTAKITTALSNRFGRRLRWASTFHRGLFSRFNQLGFQLLLRSEFGWRLAFAVTR